MSNPFSSDTPSSQQQPQLPSFTSPGSTPQSYRQSVPSTGGGSAAASLAAPSRAVKDGNPASLCRLGQETLMEIMQRTTEIFGYIRTPQLPNGVNLTIQQFTDKKTKLDDSLRRIESLFVKLREIYDSVLEASQSCEQMAVEELLPVDEFIDDTGEPAEPTRSCTPEEQKLIEQIRLKNRQLKEVIDHQRMVIWEINTMMAMRRTPS